MGIKQIVEVTDDLTGKKLTEQPAPTVITYGGKKHEVYLSPESVERFEKFLAGDSPLIGSGTSDANPKGYDFKTVRAWAIANKVKNGKNKDKPIKDTTPILSAHVYEAYDKAEGDS